LHRGHLECHYVLTKLHENLTSGSKVISGGQRDSHFGMIEVTFMPLPQYNISSKSTNQFKSCTLLRSLNVRHFETVEATELNLMESRSSSMPSCPYKISSKSTNRFKSCTTSEVQTSAILESSTSPLVSSPLYEISTKSTNQSKRYQWVLFIHLRSLNVRHFVMKLQD
jgi:hypothetical protein